MTTPTHIIVDLATGTTTEVELSGAELEAYNASLAQQAAEVAAEQAVQEAPPTQEVPSTQETPPTQGA